MATATQITKARQTLKMLELSKQGLSSRKIAAELRVSPAKVQRCLVEGRADPELLQIAYEQPAVTSPKSVDRFAELSEKAEYWKHHAEHFKRKAERLQAQLKARGHG